MSIKKKQYLRLFYSFIGLVVIAVVGYLLISNYKAVFSPQASAYRISDCEHRRGYGSNRLQDCDRLVKKVYEADKEIADLKKSGSSDCSRLGAGKYLDGKCIKIRTAEKKKDGYHKEYAQKGVSYDKCLTLTKAPSDTRVMDCLEKCHRENVEIVRPTKAGFTPRPLINDVK